MSVISDNGTRFNNEDFREWCARHGIKNQFSTMAHPQSNGQVEVTNRTLLYALKKKVDENEKKWPELIPEILFGYNTTKKTATVFSPFELAYGCEAVLPVEII